MPACEGCGAENEALQKRVGELERKRDEARRNAELYNVDTFRVMEVRDNFEKERDAAREALATVKQVATQALEVCRLTCLKIGKKDCGCRNCMWTRQINTALARIREVGTKQRSE